MKNFIIQLIALLLLSNTILLALGLFYSPTLVVWWADVQNRRMVLKIYGLPILIMIFAYLVLYLL